jgi:hypothetical protein
MPRKRCERNPLVLLLVDLMAGILDIEEETERPENHEKGNRIEGPRRSLDELVSPQQQLGFNATQVFTSDE